MTIDATPAGFAQFRPGDRITHLGAHDLGRPVVVAEPYEEERDRLRVVNPYGSEVVYYVYPRALSGYTLTVERPEPEPQPEPAPKRSRKPASRTIDGLRLVSDGEGTWRTEDGRYEIRKEPGSWYLCDTPHPIHLPDGRWDYCRGADNEHQYPDEWVAWDTQRGDYAPTDARDTFTEVATELARIVRAQKEH